jgi:AraC-like DNA-binding protein
MKGKRGNPRFVELHALPVSAAVGNYHAEVLYWGYYDLSYWRNYLHTHSFFEICYVFSGKGTFQMHDKVLEVGPGDVFIAKPGEPHEIIASRKPGMGIYFWAYTLVAGARREGMEAIDGLLEAFMVSREYVSKRVGGMEQTIGLLTEEITRKAPGYGEMIRALTAKLILDTARSVVAEASAEEASGKTPGEAAVQQAVRYLRDNLGRQISVRDVAAQVHLSQRHLRRLFQQKMGMSLIDYLTKLRMETASAMLLDRKLAIKEVAYAAGYPDVHYFTTLFHRERGMTPGKFRASGGTRWVKHSQG